MPHLNHEERLFLHGPEELPQYERYQLYEILVWLVLRKRPLIVKNRFEELHSRDLLTYV